MAFLNQMSGINSINIYSTEIMKSIESLDPVIGNYMLMGAAVVGCVAGPITNKFFTVRSIMVYGELCLAIVLGSIALFSKYDMPYPLLGAMILFMFTY